MTPTPIPTPSAGIADGPEVTMLILAAIIILGALLVLRRPT